MRKTTKQAEKIVEKIPNIEEKYGSIFVIAAILSIIISSIRLWHYCKNRNVNVLGKLILTRKIRKEFPSATKAERAEILNAILERNNEIDDLTFGELVEECQENKN